MAETLVRAYCDGTAFSFVRSDKHSDSMFGGPIEIDISGIDHGPIPLHMVARLDGAHLRILGQRLLYNLPLIYGMCYDGCSIEYRVSDVGNIELRELRPSEFRDDWPYRNFPLLLPYVPLQLGETQPCSYAKFAEPFPNMPDAQPSELVVVVPPPATIGVSLWGSNGDAEGVTILFECDLSDRVVAATNLCS